MVFSTAMAEVYFTKAPVCKAFADNRQAVRTKKMPHDFFATWPDSWQKVKP
jgi:hypothetical protein